MLVIRQAVKNDFDNVCLFYHSLIKDMQGAKYKPGWKKDIYPNSELIKESIRNGELYIGQANDEIASAMIVNHKFNEDYLKVKWPTYAEPQELSVIHALGVHPNFWGLGYAKAMVAKVYSLAEQTKQKVVRLDVLKGNLPAKKLYISMGFRYVDSIQMFYEDTGWTDFELYEYALPTD